MLENSLGMKLSLFLSLSYNGTFRWDSNGDLEKVKIFVCVVSLNSFMSFSISEFLFLCKRTDVSKNPCQKNGQYKTKRLNDFLIYLYKLNMLFWKHQMEIQNCN